MMDNLLEKYRVLNNSFKKKYIFHVGACAGFYSELSNMIFAILYCLKYGYKFILYSKDANFGYERGWNDYFLPFCKETSFFLHSFCNTRNYKPGIKKRYLIPWKIYRFLNPDTFLTYELWDKYFCKEFDNEMFDIPELGIKGDLRSAASEIVKMIYRFNEKTERLIKNCIQSLDLNEVYISMQIRRGDKIKECKLLCPVSDYFEVAGKVNGLTKVFILTDDYSVIKEVNKKYPDWQVKTFTSVHENGYDNELFSAMPVQIKKQKLIQLFSSVEIIRQSELFIGTYTSNLGLFLGMAMSPEKVISIQRKEWPRFADDDIKDILL